MASVFFFIQPVVYLAVMSNVLRRLSASIFVISLSVGEK